MDSLELQSAGRSKHEQGRALVARPVALAALALRQFRLGTEIASLQKSVAEQRARGIDPAHHATMMKDQQRASEEIARLQDTVGDPCTARRRSSVPSPGFYSQPLRMKGGSDGPEERELRAIRRAPAHCPLPSVSVAVSAAPSQDVRGQVVTNVFALDRPEARP